MRGRRTAAVVLLASLFSSLALGASEASAAAPKPSPTPSATPSASPPPTVDAATKEVQRQQKALATESARLAKAALVATQSLQAVQKAQREAATAAVEAKAAAQRAIEAKRLTVTARSNLRSYAGSLYRGGMVDPRLLILTAALSSQTPRQFFNGIGMAAEVGNHRGQILNGLATAQAEQESAAAAAREAADSSIQATAAAAKANTAATQAVAAYRAQVESRRHKLAATTAVLQLAQAREDKISAAEHAAMAKGWKPTPQCKGRDVTGFANGQLPADALCPLDYTVGMRLRADAAYAFNTMAREYAATFGTPVCVKDSYRSLDQQVAVKAERGKFAATPGRSNHGWGIAVDLCGGVESLTSPQHQWLLANSVLFGWFHPAWAEPTGTLPEPWHWEFAG